MPANAFTNQPGEIELVLTPEDIASIRAGYEADPAWLSNNSNGSFNGLFPGGAVPFDSFNRAIFACGDPPERPKTGIAGKDRERVIIALLASTFNTYFLAVHIYWGLSEGLSPTEICQIMLIVGGYTGYSHYTSGLTTCLKTLTALKGSIELGKPLKPNAAFGALQAAFA